MIPVSTLPAGLLALLDSQNAGRNPAAMEDAYRAIIDVTPMLTLQSRDRVTGVAAAPAAGTQLFLVVPQDEIWLVHDAAIVLSSSAAIVSHQASMVMANSAGGATAVGPQQTIISSAAGLFMTGGLYRPLWLKPGEQFGLNNSQIGAAVTNCNISASVSRFGI